MDKTKYPEFRFYKKWKDKIRTIPDTDIKLALYRSIDDYGLNGIEPSALKGEILDYFNSEIRPILDKQHRQYDKRRK